MDRRGVLAGAAGAALAIALRPACRRDGATAHGNDGIRHPALRGRQSDPAGTGDVDLPPLVENGNTVPLSVSVESAMTPEDHVRRIAVFNEKNPQPNVVTVHLRPGAGHAKVSTRIRLADTQRITAIAEMSDGTYWSASADAIVTLAACLEAEPRWPGR